MTHSTRRGLLCRGSAALAALSATAGCLGGSEPTETDFDGPIVAVGPNGSNAFTPGTNEPLTIDAGTRVLFDWRSANHNIEVRDQPDGANWQGTEGDGTYHTGHTLEYTFEMPGEYHYVCTPHEGLGMVGDIVVE